MRAAEGVGPYGLESFRTGGKHYIVTHKTLLSTSSVIRLA